MTNRLVVAGLLSALVGRSVAAPDNSVPRPSGVDVVGTTDKQALLKLTSSTASSTHYGVLDLATKCIVETHLEHARVTKLLGLRDRNLVVQALADRSTQDDIRQYLALRSRFGNRKDAESIYDGDFAWSSDGTKIVATLAGSFYRSRDGGQSYEELDTNKAYKPYVTKDGRFAFFQRCSTAGRSHACDDSRKEVGIVDLDTGSKPRFVAIGRGMVEGLDPLEQQLLVVRDDEPNKVVATHLDPVTDTFTRAFSIPAPTLEPDTFFTINVSRRGRFGMFHHWISKRGDPALLANIAVVDMTSGKIVHQQRQPFVGTEVDDDGRLAWGTVNLVRTYATTPKGRIRDAGSGDRVGWAPGGRLVVFDSPRRPTGTLGDVRCKLVRVQSIN